MTEQTQLQLWETATKPRDRNPHTMTIQRDNTRRRYAAVKAAYAELRKPNPQGLRYRFSDIVAMLADQFFITTDTVEAIVRRTDC